MFGPVDDLEPAVGVFHQCGEALDPVVALYVGRPAPEKNLDALIAAARCMRLEGPRMRVDKWMTPKVITLKATDSLSAAIHLMKEKKIRRIPVVNGDGKLVGIVSDRDLKDVSPSRATTLDIWELHYVLDKLKIGDIMTKKPVTVTPDTPIERAAQIMMDKRVEGLPVLDAKGNMVGILTEGDVFRALVEITGVGKGRLRVDLLIPDKPGSIR